jgi:hypothetical protein
MSRPSYALNILIGVLAVSRRSWPRVLSTWCLWPAASPPTAANPRVADHSERSAFHASVLAARLAGMRAAARATTVTIASTPARMAGCEGSRRRESGRPRAGSPGPPGDRELFPRLRAHRLGRESASGSNRALLRLRLVLRFRAFVERPKRRLASDYDLAGPRPRRRTPVIPD